MNVVAEIENLLRQALSEPGLRPEWTSGPRSRGPLDADGLAKLERLVAEPAKHLGRPARSWDPVLVQAWMAGLIYLRDETSVVSDKADLTAKSLLVRSSRVGAFTSVAGDRVLLDRSTVGAHSVLEGPLALSRTILSPYVIAGPFVVLIEAAIAHFGKAQHTVRVEKSLIGSNTSLEGGTHFEKIPLGSMRRHIGVNIAAHCWIGQNCSITSGAELGKGVVVAPHTAVTRPVPDLVFVAGSPARHHPIDFNIRGLTPEKAHEEGVLQGHYAVDLPLFGDPVGAWKTERIVEIEYPQHAFLRGLASVNALHFQQGVLEATFLQLFPDYRVAVRFRVGASVRFEVTFDRRLVDHAAPVDSLLLRRTTRSDDGELSAEARALLARIEPTGTTLQALGGAGKGTAAQSVRVALQALALSGRLLPALFRRDEEETIRAPVSLESLWRRLVNPHAPPLPDLTEVPVAVPVVPDAPPVASGGAVAEPEAGTALPIIAAMVGRLVSATSAIDVDAPFYQLGLDSVTTAELGVLVEAHFQQASVDIFAKDTIRSLANAIDRGSR